MRMTTKQLLNAVGNGLLASAALLVVLAVVHLKTVESTVSFFDGLDNEVVLHPGRDVTFLLFSLAAVAAINGGVLIRAARMPVTTVTRR